MVPPTIGSRRRARLRRARTILQTPPSARGTFSSRLGIYLDTTDQAEFDWTEISEILQDAYRTVAPKQLVATLDHKRRAPPAPPTSR